MVTSGLLRRLLTGGSMALAGRVGSVAVSLAVNVILARLLVPREMGGYLLALNLVTFLSVVARLGMESTAMRFLAEALSLERRERVPGVVVAIAGLGGAGVILVALVVALGGRPAALEWFNSPELAEQLPLLLGWCGVLAGQGLMAAVFRGFQEFGRAVWFGGVCAGMVTLLFLLGWLAGGGAVTLASALAITVIAGVIAVSYGGYVVVTKLRGVREEAGEGESRSRLAGQVMEHSWPLLATQVTVFMATQADIWIMGVLCPPEEVAIYGVGARMVWLVSAAIAVVNMVTPPMIAELNIKGQTAQLESMLRYTATVAALPSLLVIAVYWLAGGWLIELLFGAFYREGAVILAILSLGHAANTLTGSCGFTLIMTGHRKTLMNISLITAGFSLAGAWWFGNRYGGVGVAGTVATATLLRQLAMWWYAKKLCGVWTHPSLAMAMNLATLYRQRRGG